MPPVKLAYRRYLIEFGIVMTLYTIAILARGFLLHHAQGEVLRTVIILSPVPPVWLALVTVVRYYRRVDEYAQRQSLETLSISFGVAACLVLSYAFFQDLGLPSLSIMWAWPVMGACWLVACTVRQTRDT